MFAAAPMAHQRTTDAHQRALVRRQRLLERQQEAARPKTSELLGRRPPSPPPQLLAPRPGRLGTAEVAFGVGEHAVGPAAELEARERRRRHTMGPEHAKQVAERHSAELSVRREHLRQVRDEAEQKEARAEQARRQHAAQRSAALGEAAAKRHARREAVLARRAAAAAEKLAAKSARSEARHAHEGAATADDKSAAAAAAAAAAPGDAPAPRYTALHKACAKGDLEEVKTLLEAGASSSATARGGHTPLEMAALAGHRAVVLRLLRHRQPSEAEKIRCARYALRGGHTDVAALVAPPALSKTIVRTPSQVYAATGVLEPFMMRDGFYDASVPAVRRKTESLFLCLFVVSFSLR